MKTTVEGPDKRGLVRQRRIAVAAAFLLALVGVTAVAKARNGDAAAHTGGGAGDVAAMPAMPVDAATAQHQALVDGVRATGRVEAVDAVELRPDEQGRITAILFREGQHVARGTPLIKVDDAMLRAQAERAVADRDLANQQLERVRRLRSQNASPAADLERAV